MSIDYLIKLDGTLIDIEELSNREVIGYIIESCFE